jgi:hypothetical protein
LGILVTGVTTVVAGSPGSTGTANGMGTNAKFDEAAGIVTLSTGIILVADADNAAIRSINTNGTQENFFDW